MSKYQVLGCCIFLVNLLGRKCSLKYLNIKQKSENLFLRFRLLSDSISDSSRAWGVYEKQEEDNTYHTDAHRGFHGLRHACVLQ